jgi:hypothetical protein
VQSAEERARKAADISWLNASFAHAKSVRARGVMIGFQADLDLNNVLGACGGRPDSIGGPQAPASLGRSAALERLNRRTAATYQGAGFTFLRMNTKS